MICYSHTHMEALDCLAKFSFYKLVNQTVYVYKPNSVKNMRYAIPLKYPPDLTCLTDFSPHEVVLSRDQYITDSYTV